MLSWSIQLALYTTETVARLECTFTMFPIRFSCNLKFKVLFFSQKISLEMSPAIFDQKISDVVVQE